MPFYEGMATDWPFQYDSLNFHKINRFMEYRIVQVRENVPCGTLRSFVPGHRPTAPALKHKPANHPCKKPKGGARSLCWV
jgi:hypothetical protein